MLQPVVRRTWAPRGQTPIQRTWDRHDRLSVISALTLSPIQRRVGLYFRIQDENFKTPHVLSFISQLRRHVGPRMLVIWDRLNVHRSAQRQLKEKFGSDICFEFLPAYAPELNPVEQVWSHTKYAELANNIPQDINALWRDVYRSLNAKRMNPVLLKAFYRHAGLRIEG